MHLITTYTRVAEADFARLMADPELVLELTSEVDFDPRRVDLDTDPGQLFQMMEGRWNGEEQTFSLESCWHLLHFLLTDDPGLEAPDLSSRYAPIVLGGTESGVIGAEGPVRYLTPLVVKKCSSLLNELPEEVLKEKALGQLERIQSEEIYPLGDAWIEKDLDQLWQLYPGLVRFFELAAEAGEYVLIDRC